MWLRTEKKKKEETLLNFLWNTSIFDHLYVQNSLTDFIFFLIQITRGDVAFQDMQRAFQKFLYFKKIFKKVIRFIQVFQFF